MINNQIPNLSHNSMIRVKVKTNRYLNLFVSIQDNKKVEQLSEKILQSVYELGHQNASQPPKEKNMAVISLNYGGFFISKNENVSSILKDGDEIECIFSGAKSKMSGSSNLKNSNKLESKQISNTKDLNTAEISTDHQNKSLSKDKKLSKKQKKKMKKQAKEKKRKELLKQEQARSNSIKNSKREDLDPMEKTKKEKKKEQKTEENSQKINNCQFWEKCQDSNQRGKSQQQQNKSMGSEKYQNSLNEGQKRKLDNFKAIANLKQTEDKISHSSNGLCQKESQAFDKCVELQNEKNLLKHDKLVGKGLTKELPQIQEIKQNNTSEDTETNENDDKKKSEKKVHKLIPNDKKSQGIKHCQQKQMQNEEISKTFIETESETDSLNLTPSFGEPVSQLKEITLRPKSDILAALKAKFSKNNIKQKLQK